MAIHRTILWLSCITILLALVTIPDVADATHFRYGQLTWKRTPNWKYIQFSLKAAFRNSYFTQVEGLNLQVGSTFNYGDVTVEWFPYWFDDTFSTKFLVNHVDPIADIVTAEFTFTAYSGSYGHENFYAYYENGNRLTELNNNANQPFYIEAWCEMENGHWDDSVLNSSPVSSMMAVIDAYIGQTNTWTIPVIDVQTTSFTFSLSSGLPQQPPGLSVNANTGVCSYTPTQLGLWSAQIKISKSSPTGSTIVVDFLIRVSNKPPPTSTPPILIEPTPDAGTTLTLPANSPIPAGWNIIRGTTPRASTTVTIAIGEVPYGMKVLPQTNNGGTGDVVLQWTPTTADIGVYIINIGLSDSNGVKMTEGGGVRYFYIKVIMPTCTPGPCPCKVGWNGTNCQECAKGYYGPNCIKDPPCDHGTINSGLNGDGTCICDPGWYGQFCNSSYVQRCDPNKASFTITESRGTSNVQPSAVQIYLSQNSVTPYALTSTIAYPQTLGLDAFIVLDLSAPANLTQYPQFKATYTSFPSVLVPTYRSKVNYGFGYFSDSASQANTFQLMSTIKASIATEVATIPLTTGTPQVNIQYQALISAIPTITWTPGSIRSIILVTDNDLVPDPTIRDNLIKLLAQYNVLLGVFCANDYKSVASYSWITPSIGTKWAWTPTGDPWYTQLAKNVVGPLANNMQFVVQDPGFVSGYTNPSTGVYVTSFIYNSSVTAINPVVTLRVPGYGKETVQVQTNHAPATFNTAFTMAEVATAAVTTSFPVPGSDIDNNVLTVTFSHLPATGTVKLNGTNVATGTVYNLAGSQFTFVQLPYKFGVDFLNYTVNDGCLPANGAVTFTVTKVSFPPTCNNDALTTDQFTNKAFVPKGSDPNGDALVVSFSSLATLGGFGQILYNGAPVSANTQYSQSGSFEFDPSASAASGTVSIPVIFITGGGLTTQCPIAFTIARVNVAPTISINTNQTMTPNTTLTIPFSVNDDDFGDNLVVSVTTTPMSGKFLDTASNPITVSPFTLSTFALGSSHSASASFFYTAINANEQGIKFTIKVTDTAGLSSTANVIINVVGPRMNTAPVAMPVALVSTNMNVDSAVISLVGNDADRPTYDQNLIVVINEAPGHGQLLSSTSGPLAAGQLSPLGVIYSPVQGYFGVDSFSYYVVDTMNAQSNIITVNINVVFVNTLPSVNAPDITLYGITGGGSPSKVVTLIATDVDVNDDVTVSFTALPTQGVFKNQDGSPVTINTALTSLAITYQVDESVVVNFNDAYSIRGCDKNGGCVSATGNIVFLYTTVYPPPNCTIGTKIESDQLNAKTFNVQYMDPNLNTAKISFPYLASLTSFGSISAAGVDVVEGQQYLASTLFTFTPLSTAPTDSVPISYTIVNQHDLEASCSLLINVTRVYVAPVLMINSPINVAPNTTQVIPFKIIDYGFNPAGIQATIKSVTPVIGQFADANNIAINAGPYSLGNFDVSSGSASGSISYTSANAIYPGVSFDIEITDIQGSYLTTVLINVNGSLVDYAPVATPAGPITTKQGITSDPITLAGTHPLKPRYSGDLQVFISTQPMNGSIVNGDGTTLSTNMLSPHSVAYKPAYGFFGQDSFEFYVQDNVGKQSEYLTVQVIVTKVDYPPTIELSPLTIVSELTCAVVPAVKVAFSIDVSNINNMDNLVVSITSLPTDGTIFQDGVAVAAVPAVVTDGSSLTFQPTSTGFVSYNTSFGVSACYGANICNTATGLINVLYIAAAPTGSANTFETVTNVPVAVKLTGNDCEDVASLTYQISSLPLFGTLSVNGVPITSTTQVLTTTTLSYQPNAGLSDLDTADHNGPLETLNYVVTNRHNLASRSYPLTIFVRPVPLYSGSRNLTTQENTGLPIGIDAHAPNESPFTMTITHFTGHGKLYQALNSTYHVEIPTTGVSMFMNVYNLYYMPPVDVSGINIDSFTFTLNQTYTSEAYTVYIDVTHVPRAPVFIPISYTSKGAVLPIVQDNINIYINSSTVITFNATSREIDSRELVSSIASPFSGGLLHQFNETLEDNKGEPITFRSVVNQSADGLWRMVYTPAPGRSGQGYSSFTIKVADPVNSLAGTGNLKVNVLRVNEPPVVYLNQTQQNTTVSSPVNFNSVMVIDPDSTSNNNITFTVNITMGDDTNVLVDENIVSLSMPFANRGSDCIVANNSMTCVNRNSVLNTYLSLLSVTIQKEGNYQMVVYVNDLGYNADPMFRNVSRLSDTKAVVIAVGASTTRKTNNTTILSVAIAVAAVVAAAIALAVWRIVKARAPPTDAFFGDSPFSDGSVSSNPLYTESPNSAANPLYEGAN
ncbi:hypothetical protein SAMD00019534_032020 [Acytostelium subglobosum LB1]|uniref:hypothetical protein n=1 Tax=Acytostelium subglobosum LB1 TaxID=1410327 RepID=UPI000644C2C8|nr:hypothetical protein SAMD00019534_032020 [Acytostelium subglobosum LB1]GAM20027.1 hypothetical protein SAMD00019534_032020 [Acytostelium subglobosum LB1]|eukprot:XP_012756789.1 hypothetical protein SAMD00019534_032020 [Acytostelium subglobosum LB1]